MSTIWKKSSIGMSSSPFGIVNICIISARLRLYKRVDRFNSFSLSLQDRCLNPVAYLWTFLTTSICVFRIGTGLNYHSQDVTLLMTCTNTGKYFIHECKCTFYKSKEFVRFILDWSDLRPSWNIVRRSFSWSTTFISTVLFFLSVILYMRNSCLNRFITLI